MKRVACVGILVADVIVEPISKYPQKGVLEKVNSITMHNGGNAMTAAINLKKLGNNPVIVGMVGNDMFGTFLQQKLLESGVGTEGLKVSNNVQTSASVLMIDQATKERSFFHCTGANAAFKETDINYKAIETCDIVFVTGSFLLDNFDGKDTMEFLKKCKSMRKTTVLDVCWDASGKWGEILDMSMPYIDFFMPSIDEARMLTQKNTPEEMAEIFLKKGVQSVIIKCGSQGCYVRENRHKDGTIIPAFKVKNVVDTTGAGDSFCSGFLASYARGKSITESAAFGNATGAHCCMAKGATDGIKTYDEILEFMNQYQ